MAIVEKHPNDPGATTAREMFARLACVVMRHEIKNFKCTRCGMTFKKTDWKWTDEGPRLYESDDD